jgi:hypothetical protein
MFWALYLTRNEGYQVFPYNHRFKGTPSSPSNFLFAQAPTVLHRMKEHAELNTFTMELRYLKVIMKGSGRRNIWMIQILDVAPTRTIHDQL